MDEKGFISVEYIFSVFIIFFMACSLLFYSSSLFSLSFNIDDGISHRIILDDVGGVICQVNSNGVGYSKSIKLPSDKGYFLITADKDKLTMEYDGKKAETMLPLVKMSSKYKLVSGQVYLISKTDDGIVIT